MSKTFWMTLTTMFTILTALGGWTLLEVSKNGREVAVLNKTAMINAENISGLTKTVSMHEQMLAAINASRFTASDGLGVWKELTRIQAEINKVPTEFPPKWFVVRVDTLEQKVSTLEQQMRTALDAAQTKLEENQRLLVKMSTLIEEHLKVPPR